MSSRYPIKPYPVFNATTGQSMAGDLTGKVTVIQNTSMVSYGLSWVGASPVGNISIEASNDYSENPDGSVKNTGIWKILTLSFQGQAVTQIPVSGNTGNEFVDLQTGAYAIRPIYVHASGTGTLSGTICGKNT